MKMKSPKTLSHSRGLGFGGRPARTLRTPSRTAPEVRLEERTRERARVGCEGEFECL